MEEKQELKRQKKINEEFENIKINDTGMFVKLFSNLIWIIGLISGLCLMVIGAVTTAKINNGITLTAFIILAIKGFSIILLSFLARDLLAMFYEMHFIIKHKNS